MITIFTNRKLTAGDEITVYAPTSKRGDAVRIVRRNSLASFLTAVCMGGVKALMTPTKSGKTANAHRGYRKFRVEE